MLAVVVQFLCPIANIIKNPQSMTSKTNKYSKKVKTRPFSEIYDHRDTYDLYLFVLSLPSNHQGKTETDDMKGGL